MDRLPRITVNDVPEDLKKAYQKWCVDKGVSMSMPLRLFVRWIAARQPSRLDIYDMLNIVFDDELDLSAQGQGEG
jgi:hypothetical protein